MTSVDWRGKSRLERVWGMPLKALNTSSRRILANYLDIPKQTLSSSGNQQDWEGLAELVGLPMYQIRGLHDGKTYELIEFWTQMCGSSIGQLLEFIEQMERYDILEDTVLQDRILKDVQTYQESQARLEVTAGQTPKPIQDPEIDSNSTDSDKVCHTEYKNITIGEVETGQPEFFDAFVCYATGDEGFVKELIDVLEGKHGLKLCIKDRNVVLGCANETILSYLIAQRCRKMIIILSANFMRCPECDFMVKFGHSLSPGARDKKLIPVVIQQPCPVPDILRYITQVDYTKCSVAEWFWNRLTISLKENCSTGISPSCGKLHHNMQTEPVTPERKMSPDEATEAAGCSEKATEIALVADHDDVDENSKDHQADKPESDVKRTKNFFRIFLKDSKKPKANIQEDAAKFF